MGSRLSARRRGPSPSLYVSLLSDFLPPSSGLLPPLPRLAFLRLHSLPLSGIREQCGCGGRRCVSVGSSEPQCTPTRPPPSPLPPPSPPPPLPALAPAAPKARGNGSCVGAVLPRSPSSWAQGYCWSRQLQPPSAVPAPPPGPEAAAPPAGLQRAWRGARPAARPPVRHRRRPPGRAPAGRPGRGGAVEEPQLLQQAGSAVASRPREKLLCYQAGPEQPHSCLSGGHRVPLRWPRFTCVARRHLMWPVVTTFKKNSGCHFSRGTVLQTQTGRTELPLRSHPCLHVACPQLCNLLP